MSILRKELKVKLQNVKSIYSDDHKSLEDSYLSNLNNFKFEDLVHWEGPEDSYLKEKGYHYIEKEGRGRPQHGKLYYTLLLFNSPLRVELVRIQNRDSTIKGSRTVVDTVFYE